MRSRYNPGPLKHSTSAGDESHRAILPGFGAGTLGVDVVGAPFFSDNVYVPRKGGPIGERLAIVVKQQGTLLRRFSDE